MKFSNKQKITLMYSCFISTWKVNLVTIVFLICWEWGYIMNYISTNNSSQVLTSYFDIAVYFTSQNSHIFLTLSSIFLSFACVFALKNIFQEQIIYRLKKRGSVWIEYIRYSLFLSFLYSLILSLNSIIIALYYQLESSNWSNKNSIIQKIFLSSNIAWSDINQPNYLEIMLLILLCTFLCFSVMSSTFLLCWWLSGYSVFGPFFILLINILDQLHVPSFFSFNNIEYQYWIYGQLPLRLIIPFLWLFALILIGYLAANKKEFYNATVKNRS